MIFLVYLALRLTISALNLSDFTSQLFVAVLMICFGGTIQIHFTGRTGVEELSAQVHEKF